MGLQNYMYNFYVFRKHYFLEEIGDKEEIQLVLVLLV